MRLAQADQPQASWPEQRRGAIALTFDNLGEASDLERGRWPSHAPLGRHPSVTHGLPRVLKLLSEHELRATFFVEGWNAGLYPEALQSIGAAGHEVGYHGWRHEAWAALAPSDERELLERGIRALAELALRPSGFRPPGGVLALSSSRALGELGFAYCSPAGSGLGLRDGLVLLPFRWPLIDAFHYLPHFGERRRRVLGASDPLPPERLSRTLTRAVRTVANRGGFLALVFHPFLVDTHERVEALASVLSEVRSAVGMGAVWCPPMSEIAAWARQQPSAGAWALRLDET